MRDAFHDAISKLDGTKDSEWRVVTGPNIAFIATARRIGWRLQSAQVAFDDVDGEYNFLLDPPGAVAAAVVRSVQRWQLRRALAAVPGAMPQSVDIASHHSKVSDDGSPFVDDLRPALKRVMRGAKAADDGVCWWTPCCRAYLLSAISGGQWPQAR